MARIKLCPKITGHHIKSIRRSRLLHNDITNCEMRVCETYQEQELGWSLESDASGAWVLSSCCRTWTDRLLSSWNQSIWLLHSYYKQCSMACYTQEWHRNCISYFLLIPDLLCGASASLLSYSRSVSRSVNNRSTIKFFIFCDRYGDCCIK